jgi:hypothetical protein
MRSNPLPDASRTRFDKPHLALDAYRRSSLVIGCIGDLLSIRDVTTRSALSVSEWSIEYWLTGTFSSGTSDGLFAALAVIRIIGTDAEKRGLTNLIRWN